MNRITFQSVRKVFHHRPALFNWLGRERGGETVALKDVSFSAASAEVLVLLGPNGSGKTTALKLVSTMLLPDAGSVCVGGFDVQSNPGDVRRQVGIAVAAERSFFPRLSARENLEFFATLDEVPRSEREYRIKDVLRDTGLEDQSDTLVMKFSSGMYQRLGIARALVKRPSVLLLDEPTRSLDAANTAHFWTTIGLLAKKDTTVLLATHNFAEAVAVGDRILLLHRGELLANRPVTDGENADALRAFYFRMTGEIDEAASAIFRTRRRPGTAG
jgi:ABC-2 type transport system ATP-binding protein